MIYLYVKTHNKTGLKYFGKTTNPNVFSYRGSGKKWKRHIKKYGYDVTTEILGSFECVQTCKQVAIDFSKKYNIVNSSQWANLKEENGLDGAPVGNIVSEKTKSKISNKLMGRLSPKSKYVITEPLELRSNRIKDFMRGRVWANNGKICKRVNLPLEEGWVEGRIGNIGNKGLGKKNIDGNNTRGKKIFNNGHRHGYFFQEEVPDGWAPGKMQGYQGGTGSLKKGKKLEQQNKNTIQRT